jgi:hypothetical protein
MAVPKRGFLGGVARTGCYAALYCALPLRRVGGRSPGAGARQLLLMRQFSSGMLSDVVAWYPSQ